MSLKMTYFRSKHVAELNILTLLFNEDSCVETGIDCTVHIRLSEFIAKNGCVSCK
jgi:hypothetical protein